MNPKKQKIIRSRRGRKRSILTTSRHPLRKKEEQVVAVGIDITNITNSDAEAASTAETEKLLVDEIGTKVFDEDQVQRQLKLEKVRATQQHIEVCKKHRAEWRPMEEGKMVKTRERCNHAHREVVPCLAAIQLYG